MRGINNMPRGVVLRLPEYAIKKDVKNLVRYNIKY